LEEELKQCGTQDIKEDNSYAESFQATCSLFTSRRWRFGLVDVAVVRRHCGCFTCRPNQKYVGLHNSSILYSMVRNLLCALVKHATRASQCFAKPFERSLRL
jgi:hypothetical protein